MARRVGWILCILLSATAILILSQQRFDPTGRVVPSPDSIPSATTSAEAAAHNLILISIDTLRADHLGSYGYSRNTSPRLDQRAAQGTVFLNAISASSWTLPAHTTLLTGLEPIAHNLYAYPGATALPSDEMTLAGTLREAGFRTAAFTGGGFLSHVRGLDNGFEILRSKGRRFEENLPDAEAWLTSLDPGERFFLFRHGFNTHRPYKPPPPYDRRFCRDYTGDYDTEDFHPTKPRPSPEDLVYLISQYDGEIAYVDDLLSDFLDQAEETGMLANTLLVIVSDHGDEWYEHGKMDHIHTLYDELLRVPLIFVGPGMASQGIERQIGLIDVFPTICDLLGVTPKGPVQGNSWAENIRGEDDSGSGSRGSATFAYTAFEKYPYQLASVRTDQWKLVVWSLAGMRGLDPKSEEEPPQYVYKFRDRTDDFVELFDLAEDPAEQRDVSSKHPDVVEKLTELLAQRKRESEPFEIRPVDITIIDRAYLKALRALGYLQ